MDNSTVITQMGRGPGRLSDSGATWPGPTPLHPVRRKSSRENNTELSPKGRKPVCNGRCAQKSRFGWGRYHAGRIGRMRDTPDRVHLHTHYVINDLERTKHNDQGEACISQQMWVRERDTSHVCLSSLPVNESGGFECKDRLDQISPWCKCFPEESTIVGLFPPLEPLYLTRQFQFESPSSTA